MGSTVATRGLPSSELGCWDVERAGDVRITYVPSQHWSHRGPAGTNETLWGGVIGARVGPIDAALLPIGAYDPAWFMEKQHMNPEQAVQAFTDLGARTFFAMHWAPSS